jgi:rhamnulose-1-phosphate aldolase/alcohol dehydrogenase
MRSLPAMHPSELRFVTHAWDTSKAAALGNDEVALLVYRSNLLGADLRITNFGGGNTSAKVEEPDPFEPGRATETLYVKGSGGDLGSLERKGLASLSLSRLVALQRVYRGRATEDEMVPLVDQCVVHGNRVAPSIDTTLHAFLPHRHCDHLHPDAVIAIAASADGERLTKEIWGGEVGWIPWLRPGFELAMQLARTLVEQPKLRGLVLESHGMFSWGRTSLECYENSLDLIERAARALDGGGKGKAAPFGPVASPVLPPEERRASAAAIGPALRGLVGRDRRVVGHFRDDEVVLDFLSREKAPALVRAGTSCPDHFLRTKIRPLLLDSPPGTAEEGRKKMSALVDAYRAEHAAYYERCKDAASAPMRDTAPAIVLVPRVGMWSFGPSPNEARIAGEFYVNAIRVMHGAESVSRYTALPEKDAFSVEYWALEAAKLARRPPERPLARRVAFVTGAASGIGFACAERMLAEGASAVLSDVRADVLEESVAALAKRHGRDSVRGVQVDVRSADSVRAGFREAVLAFGGVDIVVNNAGLSVSKPLGETSEADYDLMNDVMPRGSFLVAQEAVRVLREQGTGGSIVYVVSKNALAAGPNNVAYGTAKAAQLHQMRLVATEAGEFGIRVNAVNPDAVIQGSSIWEGGWAEGRAKAYGVPIEKLGEFYAQRTLLKREITPADVAAAVFAVASDLFSKTTGAVIPVDGGVTTAFPR